MTGLHAESLALGADVRPVLVDIGGIDAEHVGLGIDAVDENVIDDAPRPLGMQEYCTLPRKDFATSLVVMRCNRPSALGPLTQISPMWLTSKTPAPLRTVDVFVIDAREFDGHVVSREFGHLGARGDVILGKYGGFHIAIIRLFHS